MSSQPLALTDSGSAARGAVYTPPPLARWVARRLLDGLPAGPVTVADLACGRGALLAAVAGERRGVRLVGADVELDDLRIAAAAVPGARLIHGDALTLDDSETFDGIILNPPWGIALPHDAAALRARGYTLAEGQFDSANLFVELALARLRPGGVAAFIVPDSIFFPEHARVRRLLLERSELLLVARLGEGFFKRVYRGTAVIVVRKARASAGHAVECLRLGVDDRREVLAGRRELAALPTHRVPQARFSRSGEFDVAVRPEHTELVEKLRAQGGPWTRWFESGRGVELSKSGRVLRCPGCAFAWPQPRTARRLACPSCDARVESAGLTPETLVRPLAGAEAGWSPLVAGVDVRRYACAPTHAIRTGVPGINYKPAGSRRGERILVRKTGVGLRAALTDVEAHWTQVVFHYLPVADGPEYLAAYVQGVLASRVMLAYHLVASGEDEWRSHPYVTQKVLAALPVPDPVGDPEREAAAAGIAAAVRAHLAAPTPESDLAVERQVAGLFHLDASDVDVVATVLDRAQGLQGIRELRFDARAVG